MVKGDFRHETSQRYAAKGNYGIDRQGFQLPYGQG